jgi:hypothetical protein
MEIDNLCLNLYQYFPKSTEKDNFHNFIFGIDKMVTLGIVNSTIRETFSFQGGVDGGKPLKLPSGN